MSVPSRSTTSGTGSIIDVSRWLMADGCRLALMAKPLVRWSHASPTAPGLPEQQQRKCGEQNDAVQQVNLREREHARLRRDLSVEHEQRLLFRDDGIHAVRHEAARNHVEP